MAWRRHLSKTRVKVIAAFALFYAGLWFVTHQFGAAQVRAVAVEAMHRPSQYSETSPQRTNLFGSRFYWCTVRAYAPFILHADYGWQGGPLYGDGGSALYLWFFGPTFRIRDLGHWESGTLDDTQSVQQARCSEPGDSALVYKRGSAAPGR
jgi:hypothetical protein